MAGAGGFEPPVTGPKPVALPLGYAPPQLEYRRGLERSPAIHEQHDEQDRRHQDEDDDREELGDLPEHRDDHRDQLGGGEDPGDLAERVVAGATGDEDVEGDRGPREREDPEPPEPAETTTSRLSTSPMRSARRSLRSRIQKPRPLSPASMTGEVATRATLPDGCGTQTRARRPSRRAAERAFERLSKRP